MRTTLVLFALQFLGCAGLFVNPDLAAGRAASVHFHRIVLTPLSSNEERVYAEIRDSGFVRFPEHDFYWMQGHFIDLYLSSFDSGGSPVADEPYTGEKDITRFEGPGGPLLDPAYYLKKIMDRGYVLFQVSPCPAWAAAAFLKSGSPLLTLGLLQVKKRYLHMDSTGRDTASNTVFRRLTTFDLLTGFSRMTGPRQHFPGEEEKEEYLFETRSRFDVRCAVGSDLTRKALTIYGGHLSGSHRDFKALYVAVKPGADAGALLDSVRANARRMGFEDSLPSLQRLL